MSICLLILPCSILYSQLKDTWTWILCGIMKPLAIPIYIKWVVVAQMEATMYKWCMSYIYIYWNRNSIYTCLLVLLCSIPYLQIDNIRTWYHETIGYTQIHKMGCCRSRGSRNVQVVHVIYLSLPPAAPTRNISSSQKYPPTDICMHCLSVDINMVW